MQGEIEVMWDPSVSCLCFVHILGELYKSLPCVSQVLNVFVNGESKVREPLPVDLLVAIWSHVFLQSDCVCPRFMSNIKVLVRNLKYTHVLLIVKEGNEDEAVD